MKNISNLLNLNGKVIISSPNVENTYSRLKFLFLGYLSYFNKNDLRGDMIHINPVFEHIFLFNSRNVGLFLIKKYYNKNNPQKQLYAPGAPFFKNNNSAGKVKAQS